MNNFDENKNEWVERVVSGEVSFYALPDEWLESQRVWVRREALMRMSGGVEFVEVGDDEVLDKAGGRSCEQMIGVIKVPIGVVGPIRFFGEKRDVFVPLSTTEGALVASVQRGIKALGLAEKYDFSIDDQGMTRAPVFVVADLSQAKKIKEWMKKKENVDSLDKIAKKTSGHIALKKVMVKVVGKSVFVKFFFDTQLAMGMNMATIASGVLVEEIESRFGVRCVSLSGNGCVDKKPSWGTVLEGRGFYVQQEVVLSKKVVEKVFKTTVDKVVEVVYRKNFVGGASFGSMGFNAHYANIVAAYFLATGQDMAHVVEGSVGITTTERVDDDLYFSVTMPNILLGVVGGGTELPTQKQALELMGLGGRLNGDKYLAARNLGAVVLAGELSLTAALASGQLVGAHKKLGRRWD